MRENMKPTLNAGRKGREKREFGWTATCGFAGCALAGISRSAVDASEELPR